MLRKISILTALILIFFYNGIVLAGIRCGNDIISLGDTKMLVGSKIQSCGQILDKEFYTKEIEAQSGVDKIMIQKRIDLWSVRIREKGGNYYCYPLTFEDGFLTVIGSWNRCN